MRWRAPDGEVYRGDMERGCAEGLPSAWFEQGDAVDRGRWKKLIKIAR